MSLPTVFRSTMTMTVALALALWTTVTSDAHHSFVAVYDQQQALTLTGTVERLAWQNPHALLYLTVVDKDGTKAQWTFEMGAPRVLEQFGWSLDSARPGATVKVDGYHARAGGRQAAAEFVTLPSGQRLRSVRPFR